MHQTIAIATTKEVWEHQAMRHGATRAMIVRSSGVPMTNHQPNAVDPPKVHVSSKLMPSPLAGEIAVNARMDGRA